MNSEWYFNHFRKIKCTMQKHKSENPAAVINYNGCNENAHADTDICLHLYLKTTIIMSFKYLKKKKVIPLNV